MTNDSLRVKDAVHIDQYLQSRFPTLKRVGRLLKMCCPKHAEKSPSFVVNPETQQYKCYGACNHGGDVIDFVMWHDGLSFPDALKTLADYGHVTLTPIRTARVDDADARVLGVLKEAADYYHTLLFTGDPFLDYLTTERGLSIETIKAFQVGYASGQNLLVKHLTQFGYTQEDCLKAGLIGLGDDGRPYDRFRNRLMFPIHDDRGRVRGFGGRAWGPVTATNPKYLNSPQSDVFNKSTLLYGLHRAKGGIRQTGQAVIVEGYMDCLQAHNHGFTNVVAQMGTAFTDKQRETLAPLTQTLVFALDGDEAGQAATQRTAETHITSGLDLRLLSITGGKDPDDMIKQDAASWTAAVTASRSLVDVLIEGAVKGLPGDANVLQKQAIERRLAPLLTVPTNPVYSAENRRKLARALGLPKTQTAPVITVLKPVVKPAPLPSRAECVVLHGVLLNDDQRWIDRASAALARLCPVGLPYALGPLSPLDFPHPTAQRMMTILCEGAKGERPFDAYVDAHVMNTDADALYKHIYNPLDVIPVFKGDGQIEEADDYDTFLSYVYQLRAERLRADMAALNEMDSDEAIARWSECSHALAYLEVYA